MQFFIAPVASWLRTRRFSEPTFRPSWATNHWKNTVIRDFPTFSPHLYLLSSYSFSSTLLSSYLSLLSASALLCFSSVHIVGSLTSKLPSINYIPKTNTHTYIYIYIYICIAIHIPTHTYVYIYIYIYIPVVPHKAVAEVSEQETYRRRWLLWIRDGRAKPLIDRKVVGVVFAGVVAMVAVVTSPTTAGCSVMYCNCSCSCSVVEL